VPMLQKRIVSAARSAGRPVVVATQMLESMISSPVPTRAEASDVATAVYDGADAVMLSAESASGQFPVEAVTIMDRIIRQVEQDPAWRTSLEASHVPPESNTPDAICCALRRVTALLSPAATVAYSNSGFSCLRASRERPATPILGLTPQLTTARRLALVWGVHPVPFEDVHDVAEMVEHAQTAAVTHEFAQAGDDIVVIAGLPFGRSGSTNLLHVVKIPE
jgi:pyruvate kinase